MSPTATANAPGATREVTPPRPAGSIGRAAARKRTTMSARRTSAAGKLLALAIVVVASHLFVTGPGKASGIPTPLQLIETGAELVVTGQYWDAVGNTLLTALIGFGLSVLIGVPLGLVNGTYRKVEQS